jgi:hypothetical protein
LKQAPVNGIELLRTIYLYGVAGRQRTAVASATLKMLRAADWSRYTNRAQLLSAASMSAIAIGLR